MAIGFPDYTRAVQPAITSRRRGQTGDYYNTSYSISPNTTTIFTIGTCGAGEKWLINTVVVSTEFSFVFVVGLYEDNTVWWVQHGDLVCNILFPDPSIRTLSEGDVFKISVYNPDTVARRFYIHQHSTRERV